MKVWAVLFPNSPQNQVDLENAYESVKCDVGQRGVK
jgi:hypothetical protein